MRVPAPSPRADELWPAVADTPARPDVRPPVMEVYRRWSQAPVPPGERAGRPVRSLSMAVPRRMKANGRQALIWAVLVYAVAQLALTYTMENWLPVTFRTLLRAKWQRLGEIAASDPDRPLAVMLGSSRTEYGLRADRLEGLAGPDGKPFKAYNYGLPALGPLYAGLSLHEMLDAGIRPRLLLVEYLPPLLNEPRKTYVSEESWTAASWLSATQLVRLWPYFNRPDHKARDWFEARTAPWYVFRREIMAWALGELRPRHAIRITVPYDRWGHKEQEVTSAEEISKRQKAAYELYHESLGCLRVGRGPAQSLRDLVETCRREQIQVVVVAMPESTTFRSWYSAEASSELRDFLGELHDRRGAGVVVASDWVADKEFVDGHHMTAEGSRAFTERLRDELQRLLARPEGVAGRDGVRPPF